VFKRNLAFKIRDGNGRIVSQVLTPVKLLYSLNGDFIGMHAVEETTSRPVMIAADTIVGIAERDGGEPYPIDLVASFDLPAEESDDGTPLDLVRRRAFLRTRGKETSRTLGRHLAHIPGDAFRIVYSRGINQRRVKDVWFASYLHGRDSAVVRDVSNRHKQTIPVSLLLAVTDPRTGRTIEDEHEIRAFVCDFRPRSLLAKVLGPRRTPEIA